MHLLPSDCISNSKRYINNQAVLLSSPAVSETQTPSSVYSLLPFFFARPTITRDGAMGNETFHWDGPIQEPHKSFTVVIEPLATRLTKPNFRFTLPPKHDYSSFRN